MKIVCTGATGFIGGSLIPALSKEGHTIVLLTRRHARNMPLDDPASAVRMVAWNGRDQGAWAKELDGAGAVLNFAGESLDRKRWTPRQKNRIMESRVNATNAIVGAIEQAGQKPGVLINASGVGYYGDRGNEVVTEESGPGKGFLADTCVRWEMAARGAERYGVRAVILRLGVVLGEQGGALRRMLLPFRFFVGGPLGPGDQWFPWVHGEDLVSIIMCALRENSYSGPINVAAPGTVTCRQFCTALGQAISRPCWFPVPSWVLQVVLGEKASIVLTGQRVVSARLADRGYSFRFPEVLPALRDVLSP